MTATKRISLVVLMVLLVVSLTVAACSTNALSKTSTLGTASNTAASPTGQVIKLVADDSGQYAPKEIKVKRGSTVRIEGDVQTLVGGMDTVIVDGYGVSKKITPKDNVLEFVADKPGTYKVHCANGMGNGQLIVEA